MVGSVFASYPSCGEKKVRIYGLKKAIKVVAKALMASVLEKKSTLIPKIKPNTMTNNLGVLNGSIKIKYIYMDGLINLKNKILFKIKT
jgi:hypothetical protein